VSSTALDVTVPVDAPAGANDELVVLTAGGVVSQRSLPVSIKPTLTGVSPPSGYAGQSVTVTGTGLNGAVDVAFGDGGGPRVPVLDRTGPTITVQVPSGLPAGQYDVTLGVDGQTVNRNASGRPVPFTVE